MKDKFNFLITEQATETLHSTIKDGVLKFNLPYLGEWKSQSFAIHVENEDHNIIGGIAGNYANDYMTVEWAWIDQQHRLQGLGKTIFKQLDEFAKSKKCKYIDVETLSFQAKGFYEKLGFSLISTLPDWVNGHDSHILRKKL